MNSIQSQAFKNIEIIIVGDSNDYNREKIQYLYENEYRVRIFKHLNKWDYDFKIKWFFEF